MKNETIKTATATTEKMYKGTTIFKILVTNDRYTNRFVTKSNGEKLHENWKALLITVRNAGHDLNAVLNPANNATDTDKATANKTFFDALSAVYAFIGDIPTADGKQGKPLNNSIMADDANTISVMLRAKCTDFGRVEKQVVTDARQAKSDIQKERDSVMKDERKKLFAKNGNVYNGVSASAVQAYAEKEDEYAKRMTDAQNAIDSLLNKADNSVFDFRPTPDSRFLRDAEIIIRKACKAQSIKTMEQIKAERRARNKQAQERRDNAKQTETAKKNK